MKQLHTNNGILHVLFLILSLSFAQSSFSQIELIQVLDGDKVHETDIDIVTTEHQLGYFTNTRIFINDNNKIWDAVAGSYIESVSYTCNNKLLVVVSSADPTLNGKIYLVDPAIPFGSPGNETVLGQTPATGPSSNPIQIDGDAIYVLTTNLLFVSYTHGATWVVDSAGLNGAHIKNFALDSVSTVYAANGTTVLKQDTTVTNWAPIGSFPAGDNPQYVYVSRIRQWILASGSGGAYISTNSGATWNIDSAGIGTALITAFSEDISGNLYVVANNKLFKSVGGAGPWVQMDAGIVALTVKAPLINSIAGYDTLFAGTSFGRFASADQGATWWADDSGIYAEQVNSLVRTPTGRLLTSAPRGIFKIDPSDASWAQTYPVAGFHANLGLYGDYAGNLFVQNPDLNNVGATPLLKSTDNGNTWAPDTAGLSAITGNLFYIDENNVQHYNSSVWGSASYTKMWSRPPSGSWAADTAGFPVTNYSNVNAICSDQNGFIYASGFFGGTNNTMRRPIGGGTWVMDTAGTYPVGHFTNMCSGHHTILGYSYTGLFMRQASSWVNIPFPAAFSGDYLMSASIDSNGVIFANFYYNSSEGIYYTRDSGATWIYAGLSKLYAHSLVSYGDTTYALTDRNIGYKLTATPFTGINNIIAKNTGSDLQVSSSPNPFNNSTAISYRIPADAFVSVKIYDVLGKEIATLADGPKTTGINMASWETKGLPQGIYYCTVTARFGTFHPESKTIRLMHLSQ